MSMPQTTRAFSLKRFPVVALLFFLVGCSGYSFEGKDYTDFVALPEDARALFISSVEIPVIEPGLESVLRSRIRDEFTRRGAVSWVDAAQATAFAHVHVKRFTADSSLTDAKEMTLKSTAMIELEMWIIRRSDGKEIWRSQAAHSESFYNQARETARKRAIDLAVQKLADTFNTHF